MLLGPFKAPNRSCQDLAQIGRFLFIPQGNCHSQLKGAKLPQSGSKRLLAKILPKTIVSQWFQKRMSIAGAGPSKIPNCSSTRLPATIWLKTAVSQGFQTAISIAGCTAPNCQNLLPKGSWLGFGPQRPFPNDPIWKFQ